MSGFSACLGALSGPDPNDLTARLQPEPDVAYRCYERSLLSSERDSLGERSAAEDGSDDRGGD